MLLEMLRVFEGLLVLIYVSGLLDLLNMVIVRHSRTKDRNVIND